MSAIHSKESMAKAKSLKTNNSRQEARGNSLDKN
jgi:hypothetical protein